MKFGWIAHLDKDKIYQRHPVTGERFAYENIPWDMVRVFELVDLESQKTIYKVARTPDVKIAWRRRHTKTTGKPEQIMHIIARKIDGKWHPIGIHEPDGRIEQLLEEEK